MTESLSFRLIVDTTEDHTVRYIQNTGELRGTAVYKPDSARPPVLLQLESLKPESPLIDKKIKSTSLTR